MDLRLHRVPVELLVQLLQQELEKLIGILLPVLAVHWVEDPEDPLKLSAVHRLRPPGLPHQAQGLGQLNVYRVRQKKNVTLLQRQAVGKQLLRIFWKNHASMILNSFFITTPVLIKF